MQQTQTLVSQLPPGMRETFKQTAANLRENYRDQYAYWLALADAFERETCIQDGYSLPELGKKLEQEIFDQYQLGDVPEEEP